MAVSAFERDHAFDKGRRETGAAAGRKKWQARQGSG